MRRDTCPCSELTALAQREFQSQHGHAKAFAFVVGLDAAQPHQLFVRDAQAVAQRAQVFFHQPAVEAIVSGRHGGVSGKDGVLGDFAQGIVETLAVIVHSLAHRLERGEHAVAFVEVIDARRDSQGRQRSHAADAKHQFLANARAVIAAVQTARQLTILRAVAFHVAIEQIQPHASHVHQPHFGVQLAGAGLDGDGHLFAIGPQRGLHRHVFDFRVEVLFALVAVEIQVLLEIALVVEQPNGHQRHIQTAGAFDMVARQDSQAAGVDRHRFVDAKFGGEVCHGLGTEHAAVRVAPGLRVVQVFLQPPVGVVDAAIEHQLGRPHFQPLGREFRQQGDGIVVELAPANRIEIAEEIDHLRMPGPPQVPGQRHALIVKRLRR